MDVSDVKALLSPDAGVQPHKRRMIAAGQAALLIEGFDPGKIDGYSGRNTNAALGRWQARHAVSPVPGASVRIPHQRDVRKVYGKPGSARCTAGKVHMPYPLVIAWDTSKTIRRFSCHRDIAARLQRAFEQALEHYGADEISRLGLDQFGGCYNYRKMRGGSSWSMHSWGIAIDLNPNQNRLRWRSDRAQFAKPEYDAFHAIMEQNGFVNLGREKGYDWMHWQAARLK